MTEPETSRPETAEPETPEVVCADAVTVRVGRLPGQIHSFVLPRNACKKTDALRAAEISGEGATVCVNGRNLGAEDPELAEGDTVLVAAPIRGN